ncbi:unnamed protein product [Penicillium olsonii]|nr:unnamed protein product [Penicillium olsonii]
MPFTASDVCKIFFAIILPPLGVFLERGCGADLLINICLTILGWIPGIIHAMYVLLTFAPGVAADQIYQLYHLQILEIPYARIRDRQSTPWKAMPTPTSTVCTQGAVRIVIQTGVSIPWWSGRN